MNAPFTGEVWYRRNAFGVVTVSIATIVANGGWTGPGIVIAEIPPGFRQAQRATLVGRWGTSLAYVELSWDGKITTQGATSNGISYACVSFSAMD